MTHMYVSSWCQVFCVAVHCVADEAAAGPHGPHHTTPHDRQPALGQSQMSIEPTHGNDVACSGQSDLARRCHIEHVHIYVPSLQALVLTRAPQAVALIGLVIGSTSPKFTFPTFLKYLHSERLPLAPHPLQPYKALIRALTRH